MLERLLARTEFEGTGNGFMMCPVLKLCTYRWKLSWGRILHENLKGPNFPASDEQIAPLTFGKTQIHALAP